MVILGNRGYFPGERRRHLSFRATHLLDQPLAPDSDSNNSFVLEPGKKKNGPLRHRVVVFRGYRNGVERVYWWYLRPGHVWKIFTRQNSFYCCASHLQQSWIVEPLKALQHNRSQYIQRQNTCLGDRRASGQGFWTMTCETSSSTTCGAEPTPNRCVTMIHAESTLFEE